MFASIQEKTGLKPCWKPFRGGSVRLSVPLRFFMMLVLAIAPGYALAGGDGESCSTPEPLTAGQQYDGNTYLDVNSITDIDGTFLAQGNSHIYSFTATRPTGSINIVSANYNFAVYLVRTCMGSRGMGMLANAFETAPTTLNFSGLVVGQTYYLIVTGSPNAHASTENGKYSLLMQTLNDGVGESCLTPEPLIAGQQYDGNTYLDANSITDIEATLLVQGNSHIYSFTATDSGGSIDITSANYDFAVYLVARCNGSTTTAPIAFAFKPAPTVLSFSGLVVGQTYYLIVAGAPDADASTENGTYSLSMSNGDGESCLSSQPLNAGQQYDGNTYLDSDFITDIDGEYIAEGNSHIYSFRATQSSGFINVISANYDFAAYLVHACMGSSGRAWIADAFGTAPAVLHFSGLVVGQTYYLIVTGAPDADESAENGNYSLSMPIPSSSEEDGGLDCASAQELAAGQTYSGNTEKAGKPIEGIGPIAIQTRSEIYSFTAGDIGNLIFADWADYGIDLYVVADCAALTPPPVASAENAPAALDLSTLVAGQKYYLIVTGGQQIGTDSVGQYSLSTLPVPPTPDAIFNNGFELPDD